MITREFSGKSKEELIEEALDTLKLTKDQVKIEVEEDNSLLPFMKKKVVVKISYEDELMFGNRALMFVKDLLEKMNIEAKIYLIEENDEKVVIEIESPDTALIIGKQGQTLEAMQTLANIVMNKSSKKWTKIVIDIEDYRNRRERSLTYIANKAASQVKKTKRAVVLEPMNPFERRIIHVTLQNDNYVTTESLGDGTFKKVKVIYVEDGNKTVPTNDEQPPVE
jgi:spoIIIJ-associated protein